MKERPIIFSAESVRAILDGRKTQTRRVVSSDWLPTIEQVLAANGKWVWDTLDYELTTPYGRLGDRLWVRETWARVCQNETHDGVYECESGCNSIVEYRADTGNPYPGDWPEEEAKGNPDVGKWRSPIHMPRKLSRITLEIVKVRVERLQDIAKDENINDVFEEGIPKLPYYSSDGEDLEVDEALDDWKELWDQLNAKRGYPWESNPWVWVIEFECV